MEGKGKSPLLGTEGMQLVCHAEGSLGLRVRMSQHGQERRNPPLGMYLLWMDCTPGPKHCPRTSVSSTSGFLPSVSSVGLKGLCTQTQGLLSPQHVLSAQGKPRCNSDHHPCACKLKSCSPQLIMVIFRLSVVQGKSDGITPTSGNPPMAFLVIRKQRGIIFVYLSCAGKISLCNQSCCECPSWDSKVLGWHQCDKSSLTSSCCL